MAGPAGARSCALCKLIRRVTELFSWGTPPTWVRGCQRRLSTLGQIAHPGSKVVGCKADSLPSASTFPGKTPKSVWAYSDVSWEEGSEGNLGKATWWRAYSILQILSMSNNFLSSMCELHYSHGSSKSAGKVPYVWLAKPRGTQCRCVGSWTVPWLSNSLSWRAQATAPLSVCLITA